MECRKTENQVRCPCTSLGCVRRGTCCQCLADHLSKKSLPRCCFPPEPEKARDRTFQGFAKAWNL